MHLNIGSLLPRHAIYRPEQTVVLFQDHSLTSRQLNGRVNRVADKTLKRVMRQPFWNDKETKIW